MTQGHLSAVQSGYGMPTEAEYQLAIFGHVAVLTPGGSVMSCRLTSSQRARLGEAQQAGYLMTNESWKNAPLINAWQVWCCMHYRPAGRVSTRRNHAEITLDFSFVPPEIQPREAAWTEASRFLNDARCMPAWPRAWRGSIYLGHEYWTVSNAPLDLADMVIRGLAAIALSMGKGGEA